MKKFKTLVIAALLLITIFAFNTKASAFDGTHWVQRDKGWRYELSAKWYLTGWQWIADTWYYFDKDGYMLHDTYTPDGYYVCPNGQWIPNYVPTNTNVSNSNIVTFADSNLEAAIRKQINKSTGTLYKSDVESITSLIIRNANIKTLNGLDNLTGLKGFAIVDTANSLNDISALKYMTNLEGVTLRSMNLTPNQVIDTLRGMKLKHIGLYGNNFKEVDKQRLADAVPTAFTDYLSVY